MEHNLKRVIPVGATLIPPHAKHVFQGEIFGVYQWPQTLFDGSTATFEMLRRPDTVNAICIHENQIIVLDDEQPGRASRRSLPGGRVDPGESIEAATRREVLEETGFEFDNWRLIEIQQPQAKIEWFIYLYVAWAGRRVAQPHPDPGEKITAEYLSLDAMKHLAKTRAGYLGEISSILEPLENIRDLQALPEYKGQLV